MQATRAWLARDPKALQTAREAYAAAPGKSADRLAFIDGFIACPDKSYMEAAMCSPKYAPGRP